MNSKGISALTKGATVIPRISPDTSGEIPGDLFNNVLISI